MALKYTPRFGLKDRFSQLLLLLLAANLGCGSSAPPDVSPDAANDNKLFETNSKEVEAEQLEELAALTSNKPSVETFKKPKEVAKPLPPGQIVDNGRTLWARPTQGPVLDLTGVAEGAETVLFIRPRSLLDSEEGLRFWKALGPAGEQAKKDLEAAANKPLKSIERLVFSLAPGEEYGMPMTTITADPKPTDEFPLLRREIELLADKIDNEFDVTLLLSPKFLLGDGGSLFVDQWKPIRDLLTDLAGEDWQAAAISFHLGDPFYWELRIVGTSATRELELAKSLGKESANWTRRLEDLITKQDWPDYSRKLIERSPAIMEMLTKYARFGTERRQAILNGYLPETAAHNLALGTELLLAGLGQSAPKKGEASVSAARITLSEKLKQPISLEFPRESLETALQLLSDATNIPISLVGRDLQLEGITRNQMLGLKIEQKPASEVLVEILRRANPDPLATGPADERQKLVYVLLGPDSEKGSIKITTRKAAESRGEKLPATFMNN